MRGVVATLLALVAAAGAVSFYGRIKEEWGLFKSMNDKEYTCDIEDKYRMKIFAENQHTVARHNALYAQKKSTFFLGPNKYSDLLNFEFNSILNGFNKHGRMGFPETCNKPEEEHGAGTRAATFISPFHFGNASLPLEVDWRKHGAVTPVKDQGRCGSCWAFSSAGALEGQHFRKAGKMVSLSEQDLIDCSTNYGNHGCHGGFMDKAIKYVIDKGINTELSYPYEAKELNCRNNPRNNGANCVGVVNIPAGNETLLMEAVATVGPVAVAIDASSQEFHMYKGGVFYHAQCSPTNLDHAVLLVGYGIDPHAGKYWALKNSWGTSWGEDGCFRLARDKNNHCGIASYAVYPIL